VAALFAAEVKLFEAVIQANPDEGHSFVDGKWLTNVFAPKRSKRKPEECRQEWIAHAIASGGLAEVRALWERITGRAP
jgi:hypothetical protein